MTSMFGWVRSAILASALFSSPVLAQDRFAVFVGSGESAEVVYVSRGNAPAYASNAAAPDQKVPLVAVVSNSGDGIDVIYMDATSASADVSRNAFDSTPLSMVLDVRGTPDSLASRGLGLDGEGWSTGE